MSSTTPVKTYSAGDTGTSAPESQTHAHGANPPHGHKSKTPTRSLTQCKMRGDHVGEAFPKLWLATWKFLLLEDGRERCAQTKKSANKYLLVERSLPSGQPRLRESEHLTTQALLGSANNSWPRCSMPPRLPQLATLEARAFFITRWPPCISTADK